MVPTRFCTIFLGAAAAMLFGGVGLAAQTKTEESEAAPSTQENWPIFRGDTSLSGVADGKLGSTAELAWTFQTEGPIISSPVVMDGTVYFGSSDMHVYAVAVETGEKHWAFLTDDIVDSPPLVHEGRVYFGSNDYFFYSVDAKTGELLWKYETDDKIVGGANWIRMPDGSTRIVFGSYDTRLYCFSDKGEKLWEYMTDNFVNGTPAIIGDQVVFGGCDAVLHFVSIATGEAVDQVPLGADCQIAGAVATTKDKVFFGHYGNAFVCIDRATGELDWTYRSPRNPFLSSPAIGEDRIVFGGQDKLLHCAGKTDGEPLWTFPTRRKIDGSPVICDGKVVFGSGDGRIYIVDLEDGHELWQYEIGASIFSSPAVVKGMVFIGANDDRLYAFRTLPAAPAK